METLSCEKVALAYRDGDRIVVHVDENNRPAIDGPSGNVLVQAALAELLHQRSAHTC